MQHLASILHARAHDDRLALVAGAERLSYAELCTAVAGVRDTLHDRGVRPGMKAVVALPNAPALPIVLMALSEIGAVPIPLNPTMAESERVRILSIATPQVLIAAKGDHELRPAASLSFLGTEYAHEPELEGIGLLIFTSGTTGVPKGVLLSADGLLLNASAVADYMALGPDDRTLIFLPLYYSYPLSQMLSTWMAGGAVVLMKNLMFPAQAISLIDEHGITGFGGVPASLSLLANLESRASRRLRYIMSAGGALPPVLVGRLEQAFPGAALVNNYGCTEIGPRATAVSYAEHPERMGSIGRAITNVTVRIIRPDLTEAAPGEAGEIVLDGPTLMKGYYKDPAGTAARLSKWGFHTGDYAHADEDGFLFFEGRRDDIFKCAGEKVSAREIEDVLLEHPGVLEAAVVSQSDDVMGHVPVAYVVARQGAAPSQEELQKFCRTKLSIHKVPRAVHHVNRLERTDSGKVRKFRLREHASAAAVSGTSHKGAAQ